MESIKGKLNSEEITKYAENTLKFTAPTIALFFTQLATGVSYKVAMCTAILALYQNLSDLFTKLGQGK